MNKQSFTDALATLVAVQYARTEEPENEALLVADLSRVLARTVALVSHAKMDQAEVLLEAAILVMRIELRDRCEYLSGSATDLGPRPTEVN